MGLACTTSSSDRLDVHGCRQARLSLSQTQEHKHAVQAVLCSLVFVPHGLLQVSM